MSESKAAIGIGAMSGRAAMSAASPVAGRPALATERPTTDVPIYGAIIGQDKALTILEDAVSRLVTTMRGSEYGSQTGKDTNEAPPAAITASVENMAVRILANTEIIEMMSKQIDEITDELGRVRIGMGI